MLRRKGWVNCVLAVSLGLGGLPADATVVTVAGDAVWQWLDPVGLRAAPAQLLPVAAASWAAVPAPLGSAATAAPTARRSWLAVLTGVVATLGLTGLAHTLAKGEALAQFLVIAVLVGLAMVLLGGLLRWRRQAVALARPGMAAQAAGARLSDPLERLKPYNPGNVGNDASARPWERHSMAFEPSRVDVEPPAVTGGAGSVGAASPGSSWGIPADFDVQGFLAVAKSNFLLLQNAWDQADVAALRAMMTDAMLAEIKTQLAERESHRGRQAQPNTTDVLMLQAHLLGLEDLGEDYLASVEFSGMVREEPSAGPNAFREVWNMTKPKSGAGGWLVAGVQALQ